MSNKTSILWMVFWVWATLLSGCSAHEPNTRELYLPAHSNDEPLTASDCNPNHAPNRWAVIIGVDFYEDARIPNLKGAINDAWTFYHFLVNPSGMGMDPRRVQLMLNQEATRSAVDNALGNFLADACPQDQVIIYFAGHGTLEQLRQPRADYTEEAFLMLHNTNLDNLVGTALSMRQLPNFLNWRAGQTRQLLMFIDACHSGAIAFPGSEEPPANEQAQALVHYALARAKGQLNTNSSSPPINTRELFTSRGNWRAVVKQVGRERDRIIAQNLDEAVATRPRWGALSASRADQNAGEAQAVCRLGGQPYTGGVFTCRTIEGLTGRADANRDNVITFGELFEHVRSQVMYDTQGEQRPQLSGNQTRSVPLFKPTNKPIAIPKVPELYRFEEEPRPLLPWAWTGAVLTGATLVASASFHLHSNNLVSELNSYNRADADISRSDYEKLQDKQTFSQNLSFYGYIACSLFAATTGTLFALDRLDELEAIDDVHQQPPAFHISTTSNSVLFGIDGAF